MPRMIGRCRGRIASARGLSLVELMVGVVLLSLLLLAMVRGFIGTTKSFTTSRVKTQVTEFAQGEVENMTRLARSPSPLGEKVAYGYWHYVVGSPPQRVVYPRQLQILNQQMIPSGGVAGTGDAQRYELMREVVVTTHTADGDGTPLAVGDPFVPERVGEYRQVSVTLTDTESPARFSPITVRTIVRRPNPEALDMRQAVNAVVRGRVVDASQTPRRGLPGTYLRVFPGDHVATTNGNGEFEFRQLNTYGTYVATVSAVDFWGKEVSFQAAQPFPAINALPDIELYPIVRAEVVVRVFNRQGRRELEGARVRIDHLGPMYSHRYPGTLSAVTDENGEARFTIVIPEPGVTTYSKYAVAWVEMEDYLEEPDEDEDGQIEPLAFTLDARRPERVDIPMTRVKKARLQVDVTGESGGVRSTLRGARVSVAENAGSALFLKRWTNDQGTVTLEVPVNTLEHKDADERTVAVKAQRVGYLGGLRENVVLEEGRTERIAIHLPPHRLEVFMVEPLYDQSTEAAPVVLPGGAVDTVECSAMYFGHTAFGSEGHDATYIRWHLPEGAASDVDSWLWRAARGNDVRLTPPLDGPTVTFEAQNNGAPSEIVCRLDYRFTYGGTEFGPYGAGPETFVLPPASKSAFVRATDTPDPSNDFAAWIFSHNQTQEIALGATEWYGIRTNYPAASMRWLRVLGPGRLASMDDQDTSLTVLPGAQVGQIITLEAEAISAVFGTRVTGFNVTITAPPAPSTTLLASFTPDQKTVYFGEIFPLPPLALRNVIGTPTIEWVLVDATGREMTLERGYSAWGQLTGSGTAATFQAFNREGTVTVRAKVTDTSGQSDYADFRISVVPSGGGVTGG